MFRKNPLRRIIPLFSSKVQNFYRVLDHLHVSNSIFRAGRLISEGVFSARLRLGCAGPSEPVFLDSGAAHATRCALARLLLATMRSLPLPTLPLNPATTPLRLRVLASSLTPTSGPADVLTSALGNACTALDISICSPHAQQGWSRLYAIQARGQTSHYGPHLPSLLRHSPNLTVLRSRKRNFVSNEVVFQRLRSGITLEIWKRSARQICSCWPFAVLPALLDPDL